MDKIRVFIVDDHYMVCEGLRRMLEHENDICVVGDAQSGEEALSCLREVEADVVLMDVRLEGIDGIETLCRLKAARPASKVIMLTSYGDEYLGPSIEAGATGYLLKRANREEMVTAIHEAANGGAPVDSQVTLKLLDRLRGGSSSLEPATLSPREKQLLELAASGLSNKEIAARQGVTEPTIKKRMSYVMQKLSANDRTHAVTTALRRGWIANPVTDG